MRSGSLIDQARRLARYAATWPPDSGTKLHRVTDIRMLAVGGEVSRHQGVPAEFLSVAPNNVDSL
ncbi:hypothetical protein EAH86_19040 [Pedococcus bigeumensis]|uniref:Uncharacterized protein n=1 Tax=Pedococcus bigeumensis TaxID=433644 RepID=A0A502CKR9_9MICO|nr:hypothetical protein EAH86_19040 [Pedococcus bigeumensis]